MLRSIDGFNEANHCLDTPVPKKSGSQGHFQMEVSQKGGTPSHHPLKTKMFHLGNHPYWCTSMTMELPGVQAF
jgi:hypothetical protein